MSFRKLRKPMYPETVVFKHDLMNGLLTVKLHLPLLNPSQSNSTIIKLGK